MNAAKAFAALALAALGVFALLAFLPNPATAAQSAGMKTIEKPAAKKKPAPPRKAARTARRLPAFMQTDPATGLAVAKARPGVRGTAPEGGLFEGREHVFGALSFKPVKAAAAKRLIRERILADNHT